MENKALRKIILLALAAFVFAANAALCRAEGVNFSALSPEKEKILKKASLEWQDGIAILHVSGAPYEMGYQHGTFLKENILDFYSKDILGCLNSEDKNRYMRAKARVLERYISRDYRKELKGLSDACGLSYEDLLLMHTVLDSASFPGPRSKLRQVLKQKKTVVFYSPDSGNKFVTIGCPGVIGVLMGINQNGVTLEEIGSSSDTVVSSPIEPRATSHEPRVSRVFTPGVPVMFLFRQWLQYANSPYDAIRIVSSSQRTIEDSVIVADTRANEGCVIDFNTKEYNATFKSDKVAVSLQYFINIKDVFNIPIAEEKPIDPFEFYSYEKQIPGYKPELKKKTDEYSHYSFSGPSVVETDYPDNTVFLDFYEPKGSDSYPVVIFISHTSGSIPQIEGEFCRDLAANGIGALLIQTAYQKNYSFSRKWLIEKLKERGVDELMELLRQLVVETRRGIDWLETQPRVKKDKIGVMGISLGGILVPVVAGVDDRVNCMGIILGGGDMGDILWNSAMTRLYKKRLIDEGIDSARELEDKLWMLDPLTFCYKAKSKPAMMINAHFDSNVPGSSTMKLWRALGKPQLIWLPSGHYTSLFEIGYAKIKTFQYFYAQLVDKKKAEDMGLDYSPGSPLSAFRFSSTRDLKFSVSGKLSGVGAGSDEIETSGLKLGVVAKDILNKGHFGGLEAFGRHEKDDRYRLDGFGGAGLFGCRLTETSNVYAKYSYESVKVHHLEPSVPTEISAPLGRKGVSILSFVYERSTYDDDLYPIDGSYRNVTLDVASSALGGVYNFSRTTGEATWYITTPHPKITFVFRAKGGWAREYGETPNVPFYERFYAGSSDTIRGYKMRYIGPKDSNDLPLGGNVMALGNAEIRFPILWGLNGAFFWDLGSVWDKMADVRIPNDLKSSIGTGLRYRTKFTVLRFDYGYPFNHNPGETGRFHFGLGVPF